MRALLVVLLLAGCSSQAPAGPEAPIADGAPPAAVEEPLAIQDGGSMLSGVDESWDFTVAPNVTFLQIRLSLVPIQGNIGQIELEAGARHNGTVVAQEDGNQFTLVGATPKPIIDIVAVERDGNMSALAGAWDVTLRGGPQVAEYSLTIEARYI